MTRKIIDVARTATPSDVGPALLADPSLVALTVDVVRPGSARFRHELWPDLEPFDVVISRWYDVDHAPPALDPDLLRPVWTFEVDEVIAIAGTPDWPAACPTPGLKHVSLLCAAVPTPEFRAAYRHHVELVHEHLPTMWRYVQNDVEIATGRDGRDFAAISELSYRSEEDYQHRWARGPASETEFRSHEGFLDLPRTVTVMCDEHVLLRSPG